MADRPHRHLAIVQQEAALRRADGERAVQEADQSAAVEPGATLQVGELAKITGKTVRAIHLYENMGLLSPVERSRGRYRLFNADSVERVRWIMKLQAVGFSLPEIQQIVRDQESAPTARDAAHRLRSVYVDKLAVVQEKLTELHRLERELVNSLNYLDACQSACEAAAPANSCPSCDRHADQPKQPPLVAGVHAS